MRTGRRLAPSLRLIGGPYVPARRQTTGTLPAHLVYEPGHLPDAATLLLVAQSAASSGFKDPDFWRACSVQAQRMLCHGTGTDLRQLARYTESAASVHYRDVELMYNLGDAAAAAAQDRHLDSDTIMLVLRAHALLAFQNDRVVQKMETSLFELLQESRATAGCLSNSLLSLSELHAAACLPASETSRQELIDGAARVTLEHISFFTAAQLCEVLQAMATFRMRGNRQVSALLLGISNSLARQSLKLSSKDCATAANAYAACRVHDEQILEALSGRLRDKEVRGALTPQQLSQVLYGFAKFTSQDIALLDLLSIEVRRHLHTLDASLMSSMLASLAKAGVSCAVLSGRATQMVRRTVTETSETAAPACDLGAATFAELRALTMAFAKLQVTDRRLYERLAESFVQCKDDNQQAVDVQPCESLVNVVHAFSKVHISPMKLFGMVMGALMSRSEEMSSREAVKLLHALAKVDYTIMPSTKERILLALRPERLQDLGIFELLKLSAASKKLGLDLPMLESQVGSVLPNEPMLAKETPQRRPVAQKTRRKSARKQKWTW
ncbi:unnamed protein product [Effrenium voratum]|nr:unnamed protein product [Effrenium voratum]